MSKEVKEAVAAIVALIVALVCLYGVLKMDTYRTEKSLWNKIHSYDTIIINCEEYNTQDIIEISAKSSPNKDGITILKMKGGTEITVTGENWTFKNKK